MYFVSKTINKLRILHETANFLSSRFQTKVVKKLQKVSKNNQNAKIKPNKTNVFKELLFLTLLWQRHILESGKSHLTYSNEGAESLEKMLKSMKMHSLLLWKWNTKTNLKITHIYLNVLDQLPFLTLMRQLYF